MAIRSNIAARKGSKTHHRREPASCSRHMRLSSPFVFSGPPRYLRLIHTVLAVVSATTASTTSLATRSWTKRRPCTAFPWQDLEHRMQFDVVVRGLSRPMRRSSSSTRYVSALVNGDNPHQMATFEDCYQRRLSGIQRQDTREGTILLGIPSR